ncbi:MAG TPA: amidohydrolase family protein [Phycisphaerae bacterium]|nr:amidohydrolase family protein [Phycisphaerae bacterium]
MTSVPQSCGLSLKRLARGAGVAVVFMLLAAPVLCADEPERLTVIRAGKIITGTGEEIHDGVIVLNGAKIQNVGKGLEYPLNAKVIDARNRVVMPGLINPSSRFGLSGYHRAEVHGNWTVADEYFPAPDAYDELLDAGYTTLALVPGGGGIPGRAIVVHTAGAQEQRVLQAPAYLRVTPDKRVLRGALERAQQEIEKVEKAKQEFEKKQEQERRAAPPASQPASQPGSQPTSVPATQPAFQPPPIDPAFQVLVDLIQKKPDVFALLELGSASDYVHFSEVLKKFDVAHQFLARNGQQSDFTFIAEQIGAKKPRVVLQPVINRAPNSAERIHVVRQFAQAGCEVSLMPLADDAEEHRQMLGRIALLVREGWTRAEALKAVTLHPARLLGLDSRLGSIEKDKDADLIFLDADPLDPLARVREVMIAGEIVRRVEVPQ